MVYQAQRLCSILFSPHTPVAIATEETKPILEEVWFIAAVSIGGTVIVLVIVCVVGVVVCSGCCIKIGKDHGKIYGESGSGILYKPQGSGFSLHAHVQCGIKQYT